jgi:hypothetical protein
METGELAWSRQMTAGDAYTVACVGADRTNCPQAQGPDLDFGSSPVLVDLANGRRALVAGQKSGMVRAIDPDRQARSSGSDASAVAGPWPACNGALRSTRIMSMSPFRTSPFAWRRRERRVAECGGGIRHAARPLPDFAMARRRRA